MIYVLNFYLQKAVKFSGCNCFLLRWQMFLVVVSFFCSQSKLAMTVQCCLRVVAAISMFLSNHEGL